MKRKALIFGMCFYFSIIINLWAADYYVDYVGGLDTNNGTSTSTPFKHSPGDDNATDTALATSLSAGDMVYFKGGVIYVGEIDVDWSGSSGNRITYDGNSGGSWGTGDAILDGNSWDERYAFDGNAGRDFITIKNFEVRNYIVGTKMNDTDNVTIQDSYFHSFYNWDLSLGNTIGDVHNSGIGIQIYNSTNIIVDNVEFTKTGHAGILIKQSGNGIEIKNCNFHDYIHWQMDIGPSSGNTLSNVYVHDNIFGNLYHYSSIYWASDADEKVQAGVGENPHQDGIFFRNPNGGTMTNLRIYNNDFYTDETLTGVGGTAQLYVSEPRRTGGIDDTIYVYNNNFQGVYPSNIVAMYFLYYGKIYIYNNTFHANSRSALALGSAGPSSTEIYIKNNIFNMEGTGTSIRADATIMARVTSDYNIYMLDGSKIVSGLANYYSLESWQNSGYGQDTHSIETSDMKLVDAKPSPADSASSDLRLASDSPAIDAGLDFSAIFNYDKDNNVRPKGSAWDIGAYESPYTSIIGSPSSPSGLKLK